MSFDLRLKDNNLALNPDGTLQTVSENEKLKQDIIKPILTTLGSNPFHRWYGTLLSQRVIGRAMGVWQIVTESERAIEDTLSNIIALQKAQARVQYVSAGEQIAAVKEINVMQHTSDPRQFDISISVITKQLTTVEETFTLRV